MAIKIINTEPHASVVKRTICKNCGCELEYTKSDVRDGRNYDYTGDFSSYKYIPCPCCGKEITV